MRGESKMANVSNVKLQQVSINLPVKLVNRVKNYARANGLPFTQAYIILLNNALKEQTMLDALPSLMNSLTYLKSMVKESKE